ncbi:MAG: hypothetical protein K2N63_08780 [Lachnospiraceae bacterium]|nr:hypothetical protein [Lachnospiraceae bacterium]
MESLSKPPMDDICFADLIGSFAVWNGVTYRETAYWNEVALFARYDTEKKTELFRIPKDSLQERFIAFANCDVEGVRYKIHKVQNGNGYFSPFSENGKILHIPVGKINEIWIQRNYGNKRIEVEIIYQRQGISQLPSDCRFYVEEMHNGNLMLSYLDHLLTVPQTKEVLKELYGERIWFAEANLAGLITDEYVSRIKIDSEEFDFTEDLAYGLITISPRKPGGNSIIHQICKNFNRLTDQAVN